MPADNSGSRFTVSLGNDDDAEVILKGLAAYSEVYEQECENVGFYKKFADKDGRFAAGVIADAPVSWSWHVSLEGSREICKEKRRFNGHDECG